MKKITTLVLVLCLISTLLLAYSTGPLPAHTGGFQDSACTACHVDFELNSGRPLGGDFSIVGVPKVYQPGKVYPIKVVISHPGQKRWGFQLASRFQSSGLQAGELIPMDSHTQVTEFDGLQFLSHSEAGTRMGIANGPIEFEFEWTAPSQDSGTILFTSAGNAANGNSDPTGDYIYTAGSFSNSAFPVEPVAAREEQRRPPHRLHEASRFIHLPAPVDLNRGDMEIHIEHRFLQALADSSPGTAFGIDSGANINLGFNYALTNDLSVGVSRARFDQIIALGGTWELQTQRDSILKLSLAGGLQGRQNLERHISGFFQLPISVDYKFLRFYGVPSLVLNSRNDQESSFPNPINPEHNHTFFLGVGVDAALTRNLSLSWEYVPRLAGFGGFGEEDPTMSSGIKIRSWGHVFSVFASTSRAFTPAEYGTNSIGDYSLGFNIYRRIR